jgi:hypothetical protein
MHSTKVIIGLFIAAGLIIIIGAGAAFILTAPEASRQLPAGSSAVLVKIDSPQNNGTVTIDVPVTITAEAFSEQAITDLQLTINGVVVPKKMYPDMVKNNRFLSAWSWTPSGDGQFILLARALTDKGMTGLSNAVQVMVTTAAATQVIPAAQPVSGPVPAPVQTQAAAFMAVSKDKPTVEAPTPFPTVESNRLVFTDQPVPAEPLEKAASGNSVPAKYMLMLQGITSKLSPIALPAAPEMQSSSGHCSTNLRITDQSETETGFFLYRLDPGAEFFRRVATLDGHPGVTNFTYSDMDLPSGNYSYYLAAFNSAGEAAGNTVFVEVKGTDCPRPAVQSLSFKEFNINPTKPVDNMYCYMSEGGNVWVRMPAGQETFVYPVNGKFNFAPYFQNTLPSRVRTGDFAIRTNCWGWKGEDLEDLGPGEMTLHNTDPGGKYGSDLGDQNKLPDNNPLFMKINAPRILYVGDISCMYYANGQTEKCKVVNKDLKKKGLFWEWFQQPFDCPFWDCAEYNFYIPADGFRVYSTCPNDSTPKLMAEIANPDQQYLNGLSSGFFDRDNCVPQKFFVRAYNNSVGESEDSPPIYWGKTWQKHKLLPSKYEYWKRTFAVDLTTKERTEVSWDITENKQPWIGYSNECHLWNNVCYESTTSIQWWFTVPGDMHSIKDASLHWSIIDVAADGAGKALKGNDCSVFFGVDAVGVHSISDDIPVIKTGNDRVAYFSTRPFVEMDGQFMAGISGPNISIAPPYVSGFDLCELNLDNVYLEYSD